MILIYFRLASFTGCNMMICVPANRIFTYNVCLNVLSQLPTLLTSEPASLRLAEDHCPAVSQCLTHLQNSLLPPVVAVLVNTEVVLWALLFLQQQPKTQMSHINTGKHPPVTRLFVLWWLPAAEQTPAPTFLPNCSSGQTDRLILKPIQQDEQHVNMINTLLHTHTIASSGFEVCQSKNVNIVFILI